MSKMVNFLLNPAYIFLLTKSCKTCFLLSSFIQFKMREPKMCNVACHAVLSAKDAKAIKEKIDDAYRVNM